MVDTKWATGCIKAEGSNPSHSTTITNLKSHVYAELLFTFV